MRSKLLIRVVLSFQYAITYLTCCAGTQIMCPAQRAAMSRTWAEADTAALRDSIASSFGPLPREKLLLTATRKAVLTCSGTAILSSFVSSHPVQRLVLDAASAQQQNAGDGQKAFVLMLDAARCEVDEQLRALPPDRRLAWRARLARAVVGLQMHVLPGELADCWREQAVRVAASGAAFRTATHQVVSTALGAQLGSSASAALTAALVEALLPSEVCAFPNWELRSLFDQRHC